MSLYLILKWLHVVLAIAALGANMTYGIWLARAAREPAVLPFVLRGVKVLDDRVANPSYGLLLITGLVMTWVGGFSLATPFIAIGIVLWVVVLLLGLLVYRPLLREQVRLAEAGQTGSAEYGALASRGRTLGIVLGVIVIVIVFDMVTKPALW